MTLRTIYGMMISMNTLQHILNEELTKSDKAEIKRMISKELDKSLKKELKKALEDVAKAQGCSFQQVLKMINQIAKAEKADLYDDG